MPGWNEDDIPDDDEDDEEVVPGDADYDLSEAHGYAWYGEEKPPVPRWAIVAVTALIIVALVVPSILIILSYT